jgi:hypothetical protein
VKWCKLWRYYFGVLTSQNKHVTKSITQNYCRSSMLTCPYTRILAHSSCYCCISNLENILNHITITILDIIHWPVFYLRTRHFGDWIVSPVRRQGIALPLEPHWVGFTWRRRQNTDSETVFYIKERTMFKIMIVILIYHRHKHMDNIKLYIKIAIYLYFNEVLSSCAWKST